MNRRAFFGTVFGGLAALIVRPKPLPPAISIPFPRLPDGLFIKGTPYRIKFDKIVLPKRSHYLPYPPIR